MPERGSRATSFSILRGSLSHPAVRAPPRPGPPPARRRRAGAPRARAAAGPGPPGSRPAGTAPPRPRPAGTPSRAPAPAAPAPAAPGPAAPGPAPSRPARSPTGRPGGGEWRARGPGVAGGGRRGAGRRDLSAAEFEHTRPPGNHSGSVLFSSYARRRMVPWPALCVCVRTCVPPYCSSCLWYVWNSNHTLGAHACFFISLCLLFASVGQASASIIASLTWTLFTSLLTHRLVPPCVDAYCFVTWDLPGDVLAAPESALCGWIGVILLEVSLISLYLFRSQYKQQHMQPPPWHLRPGPLASSLVT